ncbi:hypothetical protein DCS_00676 [Drechmeria coniospora]|uniref:Uncharacterized protein n=1 Tax=Drechmeria coniospora TaxID=98403 RepID=A0A151GR19_DRECN|nr:hypothetical protein DCS_00676 [Drechmeria coniospora]KYK59546.1 hypothetical protein DCS_00676 [Drechmeria coniospora]
MAGPARDAGMLETRGSTPQLSGLEDSPYGTGSPSPVFILEVGAATMGGLLEARREKGSSETESEGVQRLPWGPRPQPQDGSARQGDVDNQQCDSQHEQGAD